MYTMERRLEMTLPVQTNLNISIGSTRLVTFTEHTVNTYIFPLLLPNRGKIDLRFTRDLYHHTSQNTEYPCTSCYIIQHRKVRKGQTKPGKNTVKWYIKYSI
jgi:hypothetical protein